MAQNGTINPDPGWHGTAVPDLVGENDVFVDLLEAEIVLDAPDVGSDAGGESLVQGTHSAFLLDAIDLDDVIADIGGPHETDLAALLDRPVEDPEPELTAVEPDEEGGFALLSLGSGDEEDVSPSEPVILQADSTADVPTGGFVPSPVAIIVDDGSDGFGTAV